MSTNQINVLDLEFTIKEQKPREIIEIGLCAINLKDLSIFKPVNLVVRPVLGIPERCSEITGLSEDDLVFSRSFSNAHAYIMENYSLKSEFFAYGKEDFRIIREHEFRYGLKNISDSGNMDFSALYKTIKRNKKAVGLKKAMRREGLEFIGRQHCALNDAINLARLIRKVLYGFQENEKECERITSLTIRFS